MTAEKRRSYTMLISSMLIFGTIGVFRRYIPCSSGLLACSRGFLAAGSLTLWQKLRGRRVFAGIGGRNLALLIISGALMGFNWILLFEAYNRTTVAAATLCYYMEPTIVILLSPLIFRERLTVKKLLCAFVSLAGMILVSGLADSGGSLPDDFSGILMALGAAALYASVVIINKLIHVEDTCSRSIVQLLSAAVVLLPYLALTERGGGDFSLTAVIMLLIVGIFHTGFAYALYFGGMKGLSAQSIAVISYTDPVSALILSALLLGERMSVFGITGAVLIIGAALISETGRQ